MGRESKDETAKAGLLWLETTAFVISGVNSEPRELVATDVS